MKENNLETTFELNGNIIGKWISDSSNPTNITVVFNSNKTVSFIYIGFGNKGQDITENGTWSKVNNKINITWNYTDVGFENWTAQIQELSATKLVWKESIDGKTYTFVFFRQ